MASSSSGGSVSSNGPGVGITATLRIGNNAMDGATELSLGLQGGGPPTQGHICWGPDLVAGAMQGVQLIVAGGNATLIVGGTSIGLGPFAIGTIRQVSVAANVSAAGCAIQWSGLCAVFRNPDGRSQTVNMSSLLADTTKPGGIPSQMAAATPANSDNTSVSVSGQICLRYIGNGLPAANAILGTISVSA